MNIKELSQITNKLSAKQASYDKNGKAVKPVSAGISELGPGEMFRANVLNKTPEDMTLRLLPGGDIIKAKTTGSPDVRIGDTVVFKVIENQNGQVLLEMVSPGEAGGKYTLSGGVVREALTAAEMPVTHENIALVQNLAKSGMPIASEVLQKAAFFMYYDTQLNLTFPQIKFLLDEGFPAEGKTIETYRALIEGSANLNKHASEIVKAFGTLPDGALRSELIGMLLDRNAEGKEAGNLSIKESGNADEKPLPGLHNEVKGKLFADIQNNGLKDAGKFYKALGGAAEKLSEFANDALQREELPEPLRDAVSEILRNSDGIRHTLEFMSQINETKEYMHIPFIVSQNTNEAELHVFRNKRGKNKDKGVNTALVALEYPELGHVQVHIQRSGSRVQLQFRAETSKVLNILAGDTYKLSGALSGAGYSISGINFRKIGDEFEIHTVPDEWRSKDSGITKYSVDVRV